MEDSKQLCIGIVREEKNKWERRVPLTPKEVDTLIQAGIKVLIQPSTNRCFTQKEYEDVGAIFQEDISEASLIVGVKEVPIENLIADKSYMFFSHTIKAQPYNMPLLDKLLELNIRMIDYECIREDNNRLVAFGRYAGIAGAVDFFRGIGEFLLEKKYQSFFVNIASTYMYVDLPDIKEAITKVGKNICSKGLPPEFAPYVFAVTSKGRVAKGALEILELLPHEYVDPDKLDTIPQEENWKIYITVLTQEHLVERKDGETFDKAHYYANPDMYRSKFKEYYSKITFLVNCMYWEAKFPKVIIEDELWEAAASGDMKFLGFTDISADYEGSIEITRKFSDIEDPFELYSPKTRKLKNKIGEYEEGDILYHWVDHLPSEMPLDASRHFGECLCPFIESILKSDARTPFKELDLPKAIMQAIICCNGKLTPNYHYISQLRKYNEMQKREEQEIKELKTKSKGLKRAVSFTSICLSGHIFDTRFFNDAIDLLEAAKASFRILNIKWGQREEEESSATLQIFSHDVWKLNNALDRLHELADGLPVKITKNYEQELSGDEN